MTKKYRKRNKEFKFEEFLIYEYAWKGVLIPMHINNTNTWSMEDDTLWRWCWKLELTFQSIAITKQWIPFPCNGCCNEKPQSKFIKKIFFVAAASVPAYVIANFGMIHQHHYFLLKIILLFFLPFLLFFVYMLIICFQVVMQ